MANLNYPAPLRRFTGYPNSHPLSLIKQEEDVVANDLAMISRNLFKTMHGLNESYGDKLAYADFCLRAKASGYSVRYVPESTGVYFEGEESEADEDNTNGWWGSDSEVTAFSEMYGYIFLTSQLIFNKVGENNTT